MNMTSLRFGDHRINIEHRLLYHGQQLLEPDRREFELLRLLVEAHPETIGRRELIDRLWHNQEISDASLAQLVRRTRKLLGDDAKNPRYIKTLHGIGLRLIPSPIAEEDTPGQPPRKRIGLLPLVNASGEAENDWVEHGLAGILMQQLEHELELSVQLILHQSGSTRDTLQRYGCQSLLRIRLEPGLQPRCLDYRLEFADGRPEHRGRSEADSILAAASALMAPLAASLSEPEGQAGAGRSNLPSHSDNPEANEAYARGLQAAQHGDYRQAELHYRSALQVDPDFLWASAHLAESLVKQNRLQDARQCIDPLLDRDDTEPALKLQAGMTRCNISYAAGSLERASVQARQLIIDARQLGNPIAEVRAWINYGTAERACDRLEEAARALNKALELSRKHRYPIGEGMVLHNLGNIYLFSDYHQAQAHYEQAEAVFALNGQEHHRAMARLQIATMLRGQDQLDAAQRHLDEVQPIFERCGDAVNEARARIERIHIESLRGRHRESIDAFEALLGELEEKQLDYPIWLTRQLMARTWLNLHHPERAREYLVEDGRHAMSDPSYHLLKAHCLYEERDLEAAVALAEEIRQQHGNTWKEEHQRLLDGYRQARENDSWTALTI